MIIPQFKLKQSDKCLEVFIRVPYIKVTSCEFYIQSNTFKFYLKPYLLSLSFEQKLKEAQQPLKATYFHEKYILEVHLEKENFGEFFNNLDLISNVVNKKKDKKKNGKVLIEVVAGKQTINETGEEIKCNVYNYGFSMNYSNVLANLQEETLELFAFDPKNTAISQRYSLSKEIIKNEFDLDSYLFDKYENEDEIISILKDHAFVEYIEQLIQKQASVSINSEEFKLKMKISNKELLISSQHNIKREIVSIVFSYLYELICMIGEFGPESARTINQTSLILYCNSYYEEQSLEEMIAYCYRRCMTYSLYKNLEICKFVKKTLTKYMNRTYIKVILEDLRRLFEKSEPRYLINKMYIDDYLLYVYSMTDELGFNEFIQTIDACNITQAKLDLGIEEYEKQVNELDDDNQEEQVLKEETKKLVEEIEKLQTLD